MEVSCNQNTDNTHLLQITEKCLVEMVLRSILQHLCVLLPQDGLKANVEVSVKLLSVSAIPPEEEKPTRPSLCVASSIVL